MFAIMRMQDEKEPVHVVTSASPGIGFSLIVLGITQERAEDLVKALMQSLDGKYRLVESADVK